MFLSSGFYDVHDNERNELESAFAQALKDHRIEKASLNILRLFRNYFVTKEIMEGICKGVVTQDRNGYEIGKESINDNADTFCEHLKQEAINSETKLLYFLPKISEEQKQYFPNEHTFDKDFKEVFRYKEFSVFRKDPDATTRNGTFRIENQVLLFCWNQKNDPLRKLWKCCRRPL